MMNFPAPIARHGAAADLMRGREFEQLTPASLMDIVWRRIGVVVAITALLLIVAMLYLAMAPARFTATAALVPDTRRTPPTPAEVPQESLTEPALVETQIETIKSERIALTVIGKLKLVKDLEFVPEPGLGSRILSAIGIVSANPRTDEIKQRIAVANFMQMLKVVRIGQSYVTEISFTSLDPVKAATIANEIAAAYINDQLGARFFNAERAGSWMEQRIAEVRQKMKEAEREVELLRAVSNVDVDASGKSANEREMERLSAALTAAKAVTAQARQRLEGAQLALRSQGDDNRASLPEGGRLDAMGSETVNKLRREYRNLGGQDTVGVAENRGPAEAERGQNGRLADLRAEIRGEVEKAAAAYQKEFDAAVQRETALARQIAGLEPHLEVERPQLAKLREREAVVQSHRSLYDNMRNRFARISQFAQQQSLPVSEARVVTEATPPLTKSWPKSKLILFLALCAGGTLGIGAAIGREFFDRTVRKPEQIERGLGIRCLGLTPLVRDGARSKRVGRLSARRPAGQAMSGAGRDLLPPLRTERWLSELAGDAIRAIKIAVDEGNRSVTTRQVLGITSAQAGEGKTTVALSIAMLMAQVGRRTLLIDADLRDPTLTRALAPAAADGLAAALKNEAGLADYAVRHDSGFYLLPYQPGSAPGHPSDLLGSPAMRSLIDRARKSYDCIVVDLPPVLAHVDVVAAAGLLDGFVLVIDASRTPIDDVERSLETSNVMTERLLGAIVNKATPAVRLRA